jgi:hypothetical protein
MVDISLDLNPASPTYRDLLFVDNDLILTSDANPNGTNNILQDIVQNISFFFQEWFLDNTKGIPYFQQILIKNPDQSKIDAFFINTILGTPGVTQLLSYNFTPNYPGRVLNVQFSAMTTSGKVNYSGNVTTQGATS